MGRERANRRARCLGVLVVVASGVGGLSCGSDPPLRTLTSADVNDVAPGNAVGTAFSGQFILDSSVVDGCRCRVGSCRAVNPIVGSHVVLVQNGPSLVITDSIGGPSAVGQVDADGSFRMVVDQPIPSRIAFALMEGTIEAHESIQASQEVTVVGLVGVGFPVVQNLDCDLRITWHAKYLFPFP